MLLSSPVAAQQPAVEASVRATFTNFKQAVMSRDGVRAARLIDDEAEKFYNRVRVAALSAPKPKLLKMPFFLQMAVITTRHNFKREDIEKIGGREFFGKNVAIGDPGAAEAFANLTLGQVRPEPDGRSALADAVLNGKVTDLRLRFFVKDGLWRVDVMRLLKAAIAELERRFGITPRTPPDVVELVLTRDLFPVLESRSGKPVAPAVWNQMAGN
jgi:hypothetical protein